MIIVLEYNGYFGKGKNVNHATLKSNGFFNDYPYINKLTMSQFIKVLERVVKCAEYYYQLIQSM